VELQAEKEKNEGNAAAAAERVGSEPVRSKTVALRQLNGSEQKHFPKNFRSFFAELFPKKS